MEFVPNIETEEDKEEVGKVSEQSLMDVVLVIHLLSLS